MPAKKVTRQDMREAAEKYKNWGKWGPDDEIGTLNYTSAEDIVAATRLVKKGKVISLALNFDHTGPQGAKSKYPSMGRTNPIHTMLRTGTDAYSGVLDKRGIRAADDMVTMPLQCGTQWDGLGHVFYENYMWNGYDCREVTSRRRAEVRHREDQEQDGRPRRAARRRALQGRRVARRRLRHHQRRSVRDRQEAERRAQARRLCHRAHRHDGALPEGRQLGRLSGRRRAGLLRSRRSTSSRTPNWRRSPATPGAARCARTKARRASTSPGTGSRSRSWA